MDEGEEEESVTMVDVLLKEQQLEEDAQAVLGASDDKNCTYDTGYVARQALYACHTCQVEAGICLACSYACHEGHNLFELYTKRNFRCDCGNSKFQKQESNGTIVLSNPCQLCPKKSPLNELNIYNQNFRGLYCLCERPYPDADDVVQDNMLQCVICEDWYHSRHLPGIARLPDDFHEMVCGNCMQRCSFLNYYRKKYDILFETMDVEDTVPGDPEKKACILEELRCGQEEMTANETVFWREDWRAGLCRCSLCLNLYQACKVFFLVNAEDTVQAYEQRGKDQSSSQYDSGMAALLQMDHVQRSEAILSYNDLKSSLLDYLKGFADSGRVVRKQDIDTFFEKMQGRKSQCLEVKVPHFCR